jgi:hypothetical protein
MAFLRPNPLRFAVLLVVFMAGVAALADVVAPPISPIMAPPTGGSVRRPVLVELFTSEGCSSCPPADALLAQLDAQQFVQGAQAIVLSEHVTYWNRDGWIDPFSLDDVTERQEQYRTRFGLDQVYTPQAVVDGAAQVVGNDGQALSRAISKEVALPAFDIGIDEATWAGSAVQFKVRVGADSAAVHNASVTAALAVDSVETSVKTGENAGRTLHHVGVVRVMRDMGKSAFEGRELTLKLPGSANGNGSIRLVVFAVDRHSGRVLGVAERTLTRSSSTATADAQPAMAPLAHPCRMPRRL